MIKLMKRYYAFYGDLYYPRRGMRDFIGDFDTIEEAKAAITRKNTDDSLSFEVIWDSHERKEVYSD